MTPEEIVKDIVTDARYGNLHDLKAKYPELIKQYAREMCETALAERDTEIAQLKARVAELEQGVKDAITEMDRYYSLKLGVRILTDKTKPQQ